MSDMISREAAIAVATSGPYSHWGPWIVERIRALPAVQPKVKPLVWDEPRGGFHIAKLPFGGEIRIMWDLSPVRGERYILHPFSLGRIAFRTLDTAKAAAQAEYEARILSALEPAVQPDAAAIREIAEGLLSLGDNLTYIAAATDANLHRDAYSLRADALALIDNPTEGQQP